MTRRPACSAASVLAGASAGIPFSPAGLMPRNSRAVDIVLAVNWAAAGAGAGAGDVLELVQVFPLIFPTACAPTASKTSWMVTSFPRKRPGAMEPL